MRQMARERAIERRIRAVVKYLAIDYNSALDVFAPLPPKLKKSSFLKILWLIFIALCGATCIYQIRERIGHYLRVPTEFDVSNDAIEFDDMPVVTLCTKYTAEWEKLQSLIATNKSVGININAKRYWEIINMTTVIDSAHFIVKNQIYGKASMESIATVFGTCTNILKDQQALEFDHRVKLHIAFNKLTADVDLFTEQKDATVIDMMAWNWLPSNKFKKFSIIAEKYNFLNLRHQPCLAVDDYNNCQMQCYYNGFAFAIHEKFELNCVFPFMAHDNLLPYCQNVTAFDHVQDLLRYHMLVMSYLLTFCKCPKKCKTTIHYVHSDYDPGNSTEMQIYLHGSTIRTTTERFSYNFISLMCDIGGNMSLFLGLSILAIFEFANEVAKLLVRKRNLSKKLRNPLFKKIYREAKNNLLQNTSPLKLVEDSVENVSTRSKMWMKKYSLLSLKSILFFLTLLQMYELTVNYRRYPTVNVINLREDRSENRMYSVICSGNVSHILMKNKVAQMHNISTEDVNLLDLLDYYPQQFATVDDLWANSSNSELFEANFSTTVITGLGNCSRFKLPVLMFKIFTESCHYKVILESESYPLSLKNVMTFYCYQFHAIKYKKQMIKRVNTVVTPCVPTQEALQCEQQCYYRVLLSHNVTCSLPFITNLNLPSCKSYKSALHTQMAYFQAYLNTDAKKHCSCKMQCVEKVYSMTVTSLGPHPYNCLRQGQENMYWEVIEQKLSFPLIKLCCDLGSNMGSLLGISLLSTFQILPYILDGVGVFKRKFG